MPATSPDDPYQWLEEVLGEKPLAWVKERNAESTGELTRSERVPGARAPHPRDPRLRRPDPGDPEGGPLLLQLLARRQEPARPLAAHHARGVPQGQAQLGGRARSRRAGKEEKENWVWHGAQALRPEYSRALVSLSRGGADAAVVREFDLETKSFVKDGYTLPEAKSQVSWRDADSVFVGTDFGPGSLTESGYPRIVKEWKRGTPLAEAAVVFEGRPRT